MRSCTDRALNKRGSFDIGDIQHEMPIAGERLVCTRDDGTQKSFEPTFQVRAVTVVRFQKAA